MKKKVPASLVLGPLNLSLDGKLAKYQTSKWHNYIIFFFFLLLTVLSRSFDVIQYENSVLNIICHFSVRQ